MDILALIIALSTIIWYIINRFKPLWEGKKFSKYVTILVAALMSFGVVFSFNLDLINALELYDHGTLAGKILTGFVFMSGSSAISEIIEKIKK